LKILKIGRQLLRSDRRLSRLDKAPQYLQHPWRCRLSECRLPAKHQRRIGLVRELGAGRHVEIALVGLEKVDSKYYYFERIGRGRKKERKKYTEKRREQSKYW
jgi:hypothetical protein